MIDVAKQIRFWRTGAAEDLTVARELLGRDRVRHGLFFLHLSLEKALKAAVCLATQDLAPRMHNLVRLAELARLPCTWEQVDVLAELNAFNIEGRYPELLLPAPTPIEAQAYLARAEGVLQWLTSRW